MPCPQFLRRASVVIEPLEARIAPAVFIVNLSGDAEDANPGDGIADTDLATPGLQTSLRAAITEANLHANAGGPDIISFSGIGTGSSPFVISLLSALPTITEAVLIDGYTAPNTSVNNLAIGTNAVIRVVIDGSSASGSGLVLGVAGGNALASGGSTVRGLAIYGFSSGINDSGNGILIQSSNNIVEGNFLGTDQTGLSGSGNANSGVLIGWTQGSDFYSGNVIGGTSLGARNLISGNTLGVSLQSDATDTRVYNNLIGTDKLGASALANTSDGVRVIGSDNQIGGAEPGMGNVISGNDGVGIRIGSGVNTSVQGNIIGLSAGGTVAVPNNLAGIRVDNSGSQVLIGGVTPGAANVISGNEGPGIVLGSPQGDGPGDIVVVRGNRIGTDAGGTVPFGNAGAGIAIYGSIGTEIGGATPGMGNVIAFNQGAGVFVTDSTSFSSARISGNSIHDNVGLGIDLTGPNENYYGVNANDLKDGDTGPNALLNYPVISSVTNNGSSFTVNATLNAEPDTEYVIEFYAMAPSQVHGSGHGQGTVYLGSQIVTTDINGNAVATLSDNFALPIDTYFSTLAIDNGTGDTSEFSRAKGPAPVTYTWTGAMSGDWFTPGNWSPNGVPRTFDTAIYNGGTTSLNLEETVSVASFQHTGGAFTGAGMVIINSSLSWTGGVHNGPTLVLLEGATGSTAGALQWNAGNLEVRGQLSVGGSFLSFNAGAFTINEKGTLLVSTQINDSNGSNTISQFFNFGTVRKTGTGDGGVQLITFENHGVVEAVEGTFNLRGFTQLAGSLRLVGGTISSSTLITLNDGVLEGSGNVAANILNDGGYISPGGENAFGTINITGTYTQTGGGTVLADIGGLTAGTTYDRLNVSSTATLAGVLNVTIASGFAPLPGNTFSIVSAATVSGTFQFTIGQGLLTNAYTTSLAQLVRNGQTFTWDGGGGDQDWSNPLNWSPDGMPTNADVAVLNTAATISINASDVVVGDFIQTNGVLTGTKRLTTMGSFQWSGGQQTGTGTTFISLNAGLIISGTSTKTLDTRTLQTSGTSDWTGSGAVIFSNSSLLRNTGILTIHDGIAMQAGTGSGTISTAGESFIRKVGTGTVTIASGITLTNDGVIVAEAGLLSIETIGTAQDASFIARPGATISFNSTVGYTLAGEVTLDGGGTIALTGGLMTSTGQNVIVAEETTLAMSGGTFTSTGSQLTVNGNFNWSGGTLNGSGGGTVTGTMALSGAANKTLSEWQLIVNGTGTLNGAGNLVLDNNAQLQVNGLFDLQSGGGFSHSAGADGRVIVGYQATFRKSAGSASTIGAGVKLSAGGLVEVATSSLIVAGTATLNSSGTVFAGLFATFEAASNIDITGRHIFDGPGAFVVSSGTTRVLEDCEFTANGNGELVVAGGTLGGGGDIYVNNLFRWSGGTISGDGLFTSSGLALIDTGGAKTLDDRVITLAGGVVDTSSANLSLKNGGTISISSAYEIRSGHDFTDGGGGGVVEILPTGLFATNISNSQVDFFPGVLVNNSGQVGAGSGSITISGGSGTGGRFSATLNASVGFVSGTYTAMGVTTFTSSGFGQIQVFSGATLNLPAGAALTNSTSFTISDATVNLGEEFMVEPNSTFRLQSATSVLTGAGNLVVDGLMQAPNGTLSGTGAININALGLLQLGNVTLGKTINNAGTLGLGTSTVFQGGAVVNNASTLVLDGNTTASGTGTVNNLAAGTISKTGGGTAAFGSVVLNSAGNADFSGGDLTGNVTVTGGLFLPGIHNTGNFTISGGIFRGAAAPSGQVINGNVQITGGTFEVNLDGGVFSINGDYAQSNPATLKIVLGGTAVGEFDALNVSGTASLGGTLQTTLAAGYTPQNGSIYRIVDADTVTGNFNSTNIPGGFTKSLLADGVVLSAPLDPLTVTTTLDVVDGGDGVTSLREAILFANSNAGADIITFAIPGTGVHQILLTSALPTISESLTIDGYSQPGSAVNTSFTSTNAVLTIEITGTNAGTADGLVFTDQSNVVNGLVINGFSGHGIVLRSSLNTIEGCFIGTDATGNTAVPNGGNGIFVDDSLDNMIGGGDREMMNLISGNDGDGILISGANSGANLVFTNLIGTNAGANEAIGNGGAGVHLKDGTMFNVIGGDGVEILERNVISGNTLYGVWIEGVTTASNTVLGNFIGTNGNGSTDLGNVGAGVRIDSGAFSNTVGGPSGGDGNVISGNFNGVEISGTATNGNNILGNRIGTNAAGNEPVGNLSSGVVISDNAGQNIVRNNVVSGNSGAGVVVSGISSQNNEIKGNFIGTAANGLTAMPNGGNGISLLSGATATKIGGTTAGDRNVISGNGGHGILMVGFGSTGSVTSNVIQGNLIGTDKNGTGALGNGASGIVLTNASGNTIGSVAAADPQNVIAFNGDDGVTIFGATTRGNVIVGNSIHSNIGQGIDLEGNGFTPNDVGDVDTGPNDLLNFPAFTAAFRDVGMATLTGSVSGPANATLRLEFYGGTAPSVQGVVSGRTFLGFTIVTVNAVGAANFSIDVTGFGSNDFITATSTEFSGAGTSEFSPAVAAPLGDPEIVNSANSFTFIDASGDKVRVKLTGPGSILVNLQGGLTTGADIRSLELIDTTLTSKLEISVLSPSGASTTVDRIFTQGAQQHLGTIKLGPGVSLGDSGDDEFPDLRITGKLNALDIALINPHAFIKLGEGLPYDVPNDTKTPDTYNNRPTVTIGRVLGTGFVLEVTGDGTSGGVGGGGLGNITFGFWQDPGFIRTTQSIGNFLVKTGNFNGVLEVDKFHVGNVTTANAGTMTIAQGSWGSSGTEIEGTIAGFKATEFLANAVITAASIGPVTMTVGDLAGTLILTDPDAPSLPTYTINADFVGRIVSAQSIKKLNIKGDFTGSLEAPSIGAITAFSFLGTPGTTEIKATLGSLGLLTSKSGTFRDYSIVTAQSFSGIKVKLGKLTSDTVGIDNVHITALSIGNITVDLTADAKSTGVDLIGIRNSDFITTGTGTVKGTVGKLGNVLVKLKGAAGGNGVGILDATFDSRVLLNEFGTHPASTVNALGTITATVAGFGGSSAGLSDVVFEGDTIGATKVTVTRGKNPLSTAYAIDDVTYTAKGAIGAVTVAGDVTLDMISDFSVWAGGKIGAISIKSKTTAFGNLVNSAIAAGQSLNLVGSDKDLKLALTNASMGAVSLSGSMMNAKVVSGASIGAVTVGGNVTDSLVLAGARLGGDFTVGNGNDSFQRAAGIGAVNVKGALTRSSVVAGISSTNAIFGDADDALAAVAGTLALKSSMGAVTLGVGSGATAPAGMAAHDYAIQAAAIKSIKASGGDAVKDFATALYLDATTAGEDVSDVLVRILQ